MNNEQTVEIPSPMPGFVDLVVDTPYPERLNRVIAGRGIILTAKREPDGYAREDGYYVFRFTMDEKTARLSVEQEGLGKVIRTLSEPWVEKEPDISKVKLSPGAKENVLKMAEVEGLTPEQMLDKAMRFYKMVVEVLAGKGDWTAAEFNEFLLDQRMVILRQGLTEFAKKLSGADEAAQQTQGKVTHLGSGKFTVPGPTTIPAGLPPAPQLAQRVIKPRKAKGPVIEDPTVGTGRRD